MEAAPIMADFSGGAFIWNKAKSSTANGTRKCQPRRKTIPVEGMSSRGMAVMPERPAIRSAWTKTAK